MPDETSILRVAEAERDNARQRYDEHRSGCRAPVCMDCCSLDGHVMRTEQQVALLTSEGTESEALF